MFSQEFRWLAAHVRDLGPWFFNGFFVIVSMDFSKVGPEAIVIEGSFNSKLPTIWRVEKQMKSRWDEVKSEERRCNSAKVRRKKIHPRQMLEKSRNAVFFQWFVCPVSRKVGSLKRRVRSHVLFEVKMLKNCTPLWREAHFEVKMYKTRQLRSTFKSYDVQKLHAAVARSTFWSQNVQNTSASDHF